MGWPTNTPQPRLPSLPSVYTAPTQPAANPMELQAAWNAFHTPLPAAASILPDLSPEEVNYFDTAKRRATQGYGHGIAQDQFSQGNELQQHNLALQSLTRRYNEIRNRLPGSFIKRGVGQSGIAQGGYKDFNADRQQAFFQQNLAQQQNVGQHKITQDQLASVWSDTMGDIEKQRNARLATIQALRGEMR